MHSDPQLQLYFLEPCPHTVCPCLTLELKGTASGFTAYEGETKKRESLWFFQPLSLASSCCIATELQQASFFPMKFESKLFEPFPHRIPESPCISFVLKASNNIVRVAHENCVACSLSASPLHSPEVEYAMQEDVCQQR
jgi:hypothetical protein